jgi:ABC-type antimicrobial peptide transport system permease subunit
LVVGTVAWVLAVPVSLGVRALLLAGLPFGGEFDLSYPPLTLIVGLGGMLFLVSVASLWPSLSAARRTVSDILRYQ